MQTPTEPYAVKKIIWLNLIFFTVTTLVAVIGAPLYLMKYGISGSEIALFTFFAVATGMGITVGYHRHFSHSTYDAHPVVQFLLLFFGAAAFEQSALSWSSQHRDHHRYVDTERDPYNIKKGFWYAHIGWLVFWKHKFNYDNVHDLQKSRMVMHQHNHYMLWCIGAGIVTPMVIGALTGHLLGAFVFAVCTRLTFVYHSTFFINSICHMFGKATYDIYATAKDSWFIAFLTYGEGYHNFHHRFPSDYRNGVRWYQWDPSKWAIALMSRVGLTRNLRCVSRFRILDARLAGENKRAQDKLKSVMDHNRLAPALAALTHHYETLRARLAQWEAASKEFQEAFHARQVQYSADVRQDIALRRARVQAGFRELHAKWKNLMKRDKVDFANLLLTGV